MKLVLLVRVIKKIHCKEPSNEGSGRHADKQREVLRTIEQARLEGTSENHLAEPFVGKGS